MYLQGVYGVSIDIDIGTLRYVKFSVFTRLIIEKKNIKLLITV